MTSYIVYYRKPESSDTTKAWRSIPLFRYPTLDHFWDSLPYDCPVVGVEYPHPKALPLAEFKHPERCIYLLGSEDHGLSKASINACHNLIYIPGSTLQQSLNVASAGSIILYDRMGKGLK